MLFKVVKREFNLDLLRSDFVFAHSYFHVASEERKKLL